MTEAEWLTAATRPGAMLEFLQDKVSDRKLRLFGIACCRLNWDSFSDGLKQAIELAEELVDGRLEEARRAAGEVSVLDLYEEELDDDKEYISQPITDVLALISLRGYSSSDAINCSGSVAHWALGGDVSTSYRRFEEELQIEHSQFVRDIFGPRGFRTVSVDRDWLTSDVVALAEGIYEDRAFDRMPILADALQDAGCANDEILDHCRRPGEHMRGCWVVDLLLGKE